MNKDKAFSLSTREKHLLLNIARDSILLAIEGSRTNSAEQVPENLQQKTGAFVSVYIQDDLRGCIGRITSMDPLYKTIERMANAAATADSRFQPIRKNELEKLHIEISVLTPLKPINSPDEIIPGKHGIYIRKDHSSGTFLPQVAARTGWNAEQMLCECSEKKVGIGRYGWKEAELFTYEAIIFSSK